jgi:hypothetical protein
VQVLAVIMALLAIYIEGVTAIRATFDMRKARQDSKGSEGQNAGIARSRTTLDSQKSEPVTDAGLQAFLMWKRANRAREAQGLPELTQQEFEAQQAAHRSGKPPQLSTRASLKLLPN